VTVPEATNAIDIGTFWRALGARAIGAAVVAARDASGPAGFLALSATHLSASPPMLLISIGIKTSALSTIRNARHFSINYLAESDAGLADSFGGKGSLKGADRFEPARWGSLATGAPVLHGAVGSLDCELEETIERHGAVIALGRLVAYSLAGIDSAPLISFAGQMGFHSNRSSKS
jgi:flavin reductase (DIM6/NTAB) family NADH-FMN oxidoreductase RutF